MSQNPGKLTKGYIDVPRRTPFSGKSIGQVFNDMADRYFDKEMYVFYADKERKTYGEMQKESQQFAGALLKLGLKKGDTLAVWGGNHYEWLLVYWAALQIGIVVVHMRMDFPLDVQQKILIKLGVKVLVLTRSPSDISDKLCKIVPEVILNPTCSLECKSVPTLKYVISAENMKASGTMSLSEVMNMGKTVDRSTVIKACEKVDMDDNAIVCFTSGSTGFPKGVTHSHKSLYLYMDQLKISMEDAYGNQNLKNGRFALPLSFSAISAQDGALQPIYTATTTIVVSPTYNSEILANAIQDERVTGALLLIHHLNDILNLPNIDEYDFSSLEICQMGGSFIPRSLLDRAKKISKHVLVEYGGTEGFEAKQTPNDSSEIIEARVYPPVEGCEVKIVGEDGQILPIDTPGEICFRSEMLFLFYWGEEEKTKAAKRPNGWYHTGDLGTLDENGCLRITGRKVEQINKEGVNVAPGDLEKVLDEHPAVHNVVVVGVPDLRTSEEVCACIRLHPSYSKAKVTSDELIEFCRGKVSDFLVPTYVLFMETAFPNTATGKFDRRRITEQAIQTLGLKTIMNG